VRRRRFNQRGKKGKVSWSEKRGNNNILQEGIKKNGQTMPGKKEREKEKNDVANAHYTDLI